jgi:hypothetical protein
MVEVTRADLGLTENEWNDFMIDLWVMMKNRTSIEVETSCVKKKATAGEPIVVTITENDFYIPNTD